MCSIQSINSTVFLGYHFVILHLRFWIHDIEDNLDEHYFIQTPHIVRGVDSFYDDWITIDGR